MKIFVGYIPAGGGHQKAAEVIHSYLLKKSSRYAFLLNGLDYASAAFRKGYASSYDFVIKHAPWVWRGGFALTSLRPSFPWSSFTHSMLNRLHTRKLIDLLVRQQPDAVISTHFLISDVVSRLKLKGTIRSRLVTVITDYGVHPFWVAAGTDVYCVATEHTKKELLRMHVPERRIRITGIPVAEQYYGKYKKQELRASLGLDPQRFTIILITGSFGLGPLEDIVEALKDDCQIICICSRNKKLLSLLKERNYPGVHAFGFIPNLHEYMAASDVIVTKPGGMTVSELLALEIPPIFISAIPGQETTNARILINHGIGSLADSVAQVRRSVLYYLHHPQHLALVKKRIHAIRKPHCLEAIYSAVR